MSTRSGKVNQLAERMVGRQKKAQRRRVGRGSWRYDRMLECSVPTGESTKHMISRCTHDGIMRAARWPRNRCIAYVSQR